MWKGEKAMIIWTVLLLCIICDILQRRRFNDEYLIYLLAVKRFCIAKHESEEK